MSNSFVTPWTVACQAPLFMGFPRQEYWHGLPLPPPWKLLHLGIKPTSLASPALGGGWFLVFYCFFFCCCCCCLTTVPPGKPLSLYYPFNLLGICTNILSFLISVIYVLFFIDSPARGLSILFISSKSQLLSLLIFLN